MRTHSLLVIIVLVLVSGCFAYESPTGCTPYGVRLALGRIFSNSSQPEKLSVWFNTRLECPRSYITLEKQSSIKKIYCQTKKVGYNNYSSSIHRCSIESLQKGDYFEYQAYGWTGNSSDPTIPYSNTNLKSHLVDDSQQVKMVVLADWGYLITKANQYDRLDSAFDMLLKSGQPDLVLLGGDYAYDLSTGSGKNYDNFLIMLSQISVTWPCIFITGNHEYYSKYDLMLYTASFELYNLTDSNVTSLNLGTCTLILFDPNQIFYHNASKTELKERLKNSLQSARKDKPIIVASHYPLACSGFYTYHCTETLYYIPDYFDLMVDYNVALYIGAHFHSYQRLYPYRKGGQFEKILPPYSLTRQSKYLVSIVEGIAGNDELIVQFYIKILNFTAAVSYNRTGYGLMNVGPTELQYEHFKAIDPVNPTDSFKIQYDQLLGVTNLREQ